MHVYGKLPGKKRATDENKNKKPGVLIKRARVSEKNAYYLQTFLCHW